jgi:hypothetical protein
MLVAEVVSVHGAVDRLETAEREAQHHRIGERPVADPMVAMSRQAPPMLAIGSATSLCGGSLSTAGPVSIVATTCVIAKRSEHHDRCFARQADGSPERLEA